MPAAGSAVPDLRWIRDLARVDPQSRRRPDRAAGVRRNDFGRGRPAILEGAEAEPNQIVIWEF